MLKLTEVDALEVLVLVDNVTDSLSSNPPNVQPEWSVLFSGGRLRVLAGSGICCAHHGLFVQHRRPESPDRLGGSYGQGLEY